MGDTGRHSPFAENQRDWQGTAVRITISGEEDTTGEHASISVERGTTALRLLTCLAPSVSPARAH